MKSRDTAHLSCHENLSADFHTTKPKHMAFVVALITAAFAMASIEEARGENSVISTPKSASKSMKGVSQKIDLSEYPEISRFLLSDRKMTFKEIKDEVSNGVKFNKDGTEALLEQFKWEVLYREKTKKEPSNVIPIGITQMKKDIHALNEIEKALKISNKDQLGSIEKAIIIYNQTRWNSDEDNEWKDKYINDQKEAKYTKEMLIKWIIAHNPALQNKSHQSIIPKNTGVINM